MLYNRNVDGLDGGEVNLNTYNVHGKNHAFSEDKDPQVEKRFEKRFEMDDHFVLGYILYLYTLSSI